MTPRQIEKELQRQAVLFEENSKKGQITASVKFETFAEQWFNEYAVLNLRSTSLERQKLFKKRVYAAIGHYRLDRINARLIQQFINSLAENGVNQRTGGGLSRKTMVHYLSFISCVLDYAVKMDMLSDNPCRRVTVPKGETKEKQVYTIDETEKFLELLQSAPLKYRVFFVLDIYTGLRRSEMLGLEWNSDIDFDAGIIRVQRTSNYTAERGTYTDTTKTKRSQRVIKIPSEIIELLREFKSEQETERERLGNKWVETDRLFVKWNGAPMNNQTPYGWLKEFCAEHDFPFRGIHVYRHQFASLLIGAGIDPVTVSAVMGHINPNVTLGIYSHEFQEHQAKACDAVANAFSFTKKKQSAV